MGNLIAALGVLMALAVLFVSVDVAARRRVAGPSPAPRPAPGLAVGTVDGLLVVVYRAGSPSDAEWEIYLDRVRHHGVKSAKQLVFTEGGQPAPSQRRRLAALLERGVPIAVLTNDAGIRTLVTALSWFQWTIRAFPAARLVDALEFLDVPESRAPEIVSVSRRLWGQG